MTSPAILIVEDDANLREALLDTLRAESLPVLSADSGPQALQIVNSNPVGLVISDLQMEPMDGAALLGKIRESNPYLPGVLMTAHGTIENAVDAMRDGAVDYLQKPFDADVLRAVVAKYWQGDAVPDDLVAEDPVTQECLNMAARVAATEATVTLSGESGCGKEVIARYIHDQSPRSAAPFIAINCAAIPENMLEAVLFGYEKGAFTGATSAYAGKFEQAENGTLLLDEISEMDLALQAKLLRVLQEKEVERIGGRRTIKLNVRVLTTTNRDLLAHVAQGKFREDLYYRLNVFPLHISPLRDRPADILPLAEHSLRKFACPSNGVLQLSSCAQQALQRHTWPGNVRELQNLIQRTVILAQGGSIDAKDLAFEARPAHDEVATGDLSQGVQNHEFQLIVDALNDHHGNRSAVAGALGISARTLRYKLARMRENGVQIPGEDHE
ncbi:MAG: sigma-54 dependent transcriptional regulator [Pseudomonadota bacterium]